MTIAAAKKTDAWVRWLIRRDMAAVLEIEHESFPEPWTDGEIIKRLRKTSSIAMVAELGDVVAGFMLYELTPLTMVVHRFAVHPNYRRIGVGRRMVAKLNAKLSHRRNAVLMDVSEANLPAQLFLRATGFRCVGISRETDVEAIYHFELRGGK